MKPRIFTVLGSSTFKKCNRFCHRTNIKHVNQAESGTENFLKDFKKCHVQTSFFQKCLLGLGSGVIALASPSRGDMVAVMGEITGPKALKHVRDKMLESKEGKQILDEKPRISSGAVDLQKLKYYPEGTLGKSYSNFLEKYGYTPDSRNSVRFVDDVELAYVAQRYREAHDLFHTLLGMPTNMLGEVTVKWIEAIQTRLPMCVTGALFGSIRLAPKLTRSYSTKTTLKINIDLDEKVAKNEINPKSHSGVMKLKCVHLPKYIQERIDIVLEKKDIKGIYKRAEELQNYLLLREPSADGGKKTRQIIHNKIVNELDNSATKNKMKNAGMQNLKKFNPVRYNKDQSLQYLVMRSPADFAALSRVFNEIALRDKEFSPRNIFDFGSGVGTVVWAANEFWGKTLQEYYCVDSSNHMLELGERILRNNNIYSPSIINNVYYRQFLPSSNKPFDIVVGAFTLLDLKNSMEQMKVLTALWNMTMSYLVLVENGCQSGFEIINKARSFILEASKKFNIECSVFAPCPHELTCPRMSNLEKFIPCYFKIAYKHLNYSNYRDKTGIQKFSFLILKKGEKPLIKNRKPRFVKKVLKRHKHVVCHLCTNEGKIEILKASAAKVGKSAYKCIKHSNWGDLIPEGIDIEFADDSQELMSDQDSDSEFEEYSDGNDESDNKVESEKKSNNDLN